MYAMDMSWADGRMRKRVCERACGRVTDRTTELAGGKTVGVRMDGIRLTKEERLDPGKRLATLTMTARKQIIPLSHRRSYTALSKQVSASPAPSRWQPPQ